MSEKRTTIILKGDNGLAEWGEKTVPEMIKAYRSYHQYLLEKAQKVLNAPDEAFQIDVVRGVHVEKHIKTLQQAKDTRTQPGAVTNVGDENQHEKDAEIARHQ